MGNQTSSGGLFGRSGNGGSMETVYFVQPSRRGAWGNQRYKSPKMEQEVENAYLNKLISECEQSKGRSNDKLKKIKSNTMRTKQRQKLLKKLMKSRRSNKQCKKLYDYVDSL